MRRRLLDATDRRIAAVAHLSIGFGVVVGVGFLVGLAVNAVIWLRSRHSPTVEFHAEQAGAYQLFVLLSNILFIVVWLGGLAFMMTGLPAGEGLLSFKNVTIGGWLLLLIPEIVWYFGSIFYGLYAGTKVAIGGEFTYPVIGTWVKRRLTNRARKF